MVPTAGMQDRVIPIGFDPINLLWRKTWTEARYPSKNKVDHVTRHSDEFPAGPESFWAGHPPE
jgi:hypothetical protein